MSPSIIINNGNIPKELSYFDIIMYNSIIDQMKVENFREALSIGIYKTSYSLFLNKFRELGFLEIADGRIIKLRDNFLLTKEEIIFNELYWENNDL